jgi:peroxiredoxin
MVGIGLMRNGLSQALAIGALSFSFAVGCGGSTPDASSAGGGGLIGNPAPSFSLSQVGAAGRVSTDNLKGKVVILDFWGTFCEPCKKSFPKLQDLYAKYKPQLQIVGISEDDEKDGIQDFINTYSAKFTIAWDGPDKGVAPKYNVSTMPSSYVIDKKGVVRYAHSGYHDGEEVELEGEVKELLDEK